MNVSRIDPVLRDVCAYLAGMPHLTHDDRLRAASDALTALTGRAPRVMSVRAAVFSRSALYHLGGAMIPTTRGEAEQFREQCRGGFVELHSAARPHLILVLDDAILELTHSSQWNDRGVFIRPFTEARSHAGSWTVDGLPFGVKVAYEADPSSEASHLALSDAAVAATQELIVRFDSHRAA